MVDPFLKAGWSVEFYPLNEDLTADVQILYMLLTSRHPEAVLTMNYFGSASTKPTVDCVKTVSSSCVCIEDFSHCTFGLSHIFNPEVEHFVIFLIKNKTM